MVQPDRPCASNEGETAVEHSRGYIEDFQQSCALPPHVLVQVPVIEARFRELGRGDLLVRNDSQFGRYFFSERIVGWGHGKAAKFRIGNKQEWAMSMREYYFLTTGRYAKRKDDRVARFTKLVIH